MARPQLAPGTMGKASLRQRGTTWQARAKARTYGGDLIQLTATGSTESEAVAELERQLRGATVFMSADLSENSTVSQAIDAWLEGRRAAVVTGALKPQSYEKYVSTSKAVKKLVGALPLHQAGPARVLPLIERITLAHGPARGRSFRVVLQGAFSTAVSREAMTRNPLTDAPSIRSTRQIDSWLSKDQFLAMRASIIAWGGRSSRRSDWEKLLALVDTAMGTSMRIGEVLALRPMDLALDGAQPSAELTGTIVEVEGRLVRQNVPKRHGQERIIPLPTVVATTLRALTARAEAPESLIFGTRTGAPEGNPGRLLASWRKSGEGRAWIESVGIPPEQVTFKLMRRSAAALVRRDLGLAAAQALLGHRYESTTEGSYTPMPMVDPTTAKTLTKMWE
ncbi:tyrosine-type recombinase/integrase [Microbacterium sp. HA-8]|uniref:hypothetical protein n=1 Tax=Microbacterium sp. HA-8 TaxID=3234200 RepID=UPI0038F7FD1D